MYTNEQLYTAVQDFVNGAVLPIKFNIEKSTFAKVAVPQEVLEEMTDAVEGINSYREDFPDDLLQALQIVVIKGLKNIYKKYKE